MVLPSLKLKELTMSKKCKEMISNKLSYTLMKMQNYLEELLGMKMRKDMNVGITMPLKNTTTNLEI